MNDIRRQEIANYIVNQRNTGKRAAIVTAGIVTLLLAVLVIIVIAL
jgi:hypothetical protein